MQVGSQSATSKSRASHSASSYGVAVRGRNVYDSTESFPRALFSSVTKYIPTSHRIGHAIVAALDVSLHGTRARHFFPMYFRGRAAEAAAQINVYGKLMRQLDEVERFRDMTGNEVYVEAGVQARTANRHPRSMTENEIAGNCPSPVGLAHAAMRCRKSRVRLPY